MDYPNFIVSNQKEEFISIQRAKPCHAEYFMYYCNINHKFYPICLQHSVYKHVFTSRIENSGNSDQIALPKA